MTLISKGQISLEFMLIVAVSISLIILFIPIFVNISNFTLFAIDLYSSSLLVNNVEKNYNLLNSLSDNSRIRMSTNTINNLIIDCKNNFSLIVGNEAFQKEISKGYNINCNSISSKGYREFVIYKQNGKIIIE